jgi:tetratricopeptide (TPR) repeat protein
VDEALKLAEAAIKAGNYEGYLIKAQALARKGQWTQALEEYVKGMDLLSRSGQNRIKPAYAAELRFLIQNHPAFKRPDSLNPPDPLLGEKHFALGMRWYNAHVFAEAEKEFFEAVRYNDQDARYWYYLGLVRLDQGKRTEADDSFRAGALLERQNKPSPAAVSFSLERVQGPIRQTLNSYRP